jgi:CRP-like cAMP-binding protein
MATLKSIPRRWTRGESLTWEESRRDYLPGEGWVLAVAFVASNDVRQFTATAVGDVHLVELTPAQTLEFQPGTYRYQIRVENAGSGAARVLEHGAVEVLQSFAHVSSGYDARSHNERVLEAINAVMEGKAATDQQNLAVGGRSLSRYAWQDLLELRREYEWRLRREREDARAAAGLPMTTNRQVRFV